MGWRFRRTLNLGPLRGTLSKSGLGLSFGVPGIRLGVGPDGRRQLTLGFPGLGVSWTKSLGRPRGDVGGEAPRLGTAMRGERNSEFVDD